MTVTRTFKPTTARLWDPSLSEKAIAVLMSGGVDSSTAASLLKDEGWQIIGVTMRMASVSDSSPKPIEDASRVCMYLDIPHYLVDLGEEFSQWVLEPFRRSYREGLTPNPCVDCNVHIKFGLVWEDVRRTFAVEHLATGHYARILEEGTRARLARANGRSKDQSYFLYRISRRLLPKIHFPLGQLTGKEQVRSLARAKGLPVAEKRESMDLCFLANENYRHLFESDSSDKRGLIVDSSGKVLAEHDGIENFTIGQRRGLGFAAGKPVYVTHIDPVDNRVVVGEFEEASSRRVLAANVNLHQEGSLESGTRFFGKIRSRGEPSPCTVSACSDSSLDVEFDTPQFAPTPGQHLVLYDADDIVVAGGVLLPSA